MGGREVPSAHPLQLLSVQGGVYLPPLPSCLETGHVPSRADPDRNRLCARSAPEWLPVADAPLLLTQQDTPWVPSPPPCRPCAAWGRIKADSVAPQAVPVGCSRGKGGAQEQRQQQEEGQGLDVNARGGPYLFAPSCYGFGHG